MGKTNRDKVIAWRDDLIAKPVGRSKIQLDDVEFDYEDGKTEWNLSVEFDSAARGKGFRSTKSIQDVFDQAIDYLERCAWLEVDMYDFDDDDECIAQIISKRDKKKIGDQFDQFKRDICRAVGTGTYSMELGRGMFATYAYNDHVMQHTVKLYHGERQISHHDHHDKNMVLIPVLIDLVEYMDLNKQHKMIGEDDDAALLGYLNRKEK